jgi:uncharacterized protein YjbJ (UPF0337 family)
MSDNTNQQQKPSEITGQFDSVLGTLQQAVRYPTLSPFSPPLLSPPQAGNIAGSDSWQKAGEERHLKGEQTMAAAKAQKEVERFKDTVTGKTDTIFGAITGDTKLQEEGTLAFFFFPFAFDFFTCSIYYRPEETREVQLNLFVLLVVRFLKFPPLILVIYCFLS